MGRILAIVDSGVEFTQNIPDILLKNKASFEKTYVFTDNEKVDASITGDAQFLLFPVEFNTEPKRRNYINRYFRDRGFTGFLHVISSSTKMLSDPSAFIADLEKMMSVFDYSVWLSTVTDRCNYVYNRYTPRISIDLDRPDVQIKTGLTGRLNFTSHANTQWMAYDFSKIEDDLIRFDERFTIPMYFIIEFLARRRNTKKNNIPYFMNQYLTVSSEVGVFKNIDNAPKDNTPKNLFQQEGAVFESMKVNYQQDGNVDQILEVFWTKLRDYMGIPG